MKKFEDFWQEHGSDYIDYIKSVAMEDFKILNNHVEEKMVAHIEINTDDDFSLVGGDSFTIYGKNYQDILINTISFLRKIKFAYIPDWAKEDNGDVKDSFSSRWYSIRDNAIIELEEGSTYVDLGGNQTIRINIDEFTPTTSLMKFNKK